jgi:nucleoid DNA-binding protein
MSLTVNQIELLTEELSESFDESELGVFVKTELGLDLWSVVGRGPITKVAFDLVAYYLRRGEVAQLIQAAADARPSRPALQRLRKAVGQPYPELVGAGERDPVTPGAAGAAELGAAQAGVFTQAGVAGPLANSGVGTREVELVLKGHLDQLDAKALGEAVRALCQLVGTEGEVRVRRIVSGSILLELEMTPEDAERVLAAFKKGRLKRLGVLSVADRGEVGDREETLEEPELGDDGLETAWDALAAEEPTLPVAEAAGPLVDPVEPLFDPVDPVADPAEPETTPTRRKTKKDIVKEVHKKVSDMGLVTGGHLTQKAVTEIVQGTFDAIVEALVSDGRFELRNFGVFGVKARKARKARNPRTGAPVTVEAKQVVTFQPGKEMEERVRQYGRPVKPLPKTRRRKADIDDVGAVATPEVDAPRADSPESESAYMHSDR